MDQRSVLILLLSLFFIILIIAKMGWTAEHNAIASLNQTIKLNGMKIGEGSIKVIVYLDFNCPFSQKFFEQVYPRIINSNTSFFFKCLPSTRNSREVCKFVYCSYKQGKLNESMKLIFENKGEWNYLTTPELRVKLKEYAKLLKEDTPSFISCLQDESLDELINSFYDESNELGISGTPSFVVIARKDKNSVISSAKIVEAKSVFYSNKEYIILIEGNRPFTYFKSFFERLS